MNSEKIFTNEVSIQEVGQLFKLAIGDMASFLSIPSCIWCSLTKQ